MALSKQHFAHGEASLLRVVTGDAGLKPFERRRWRGCGVRPSPAGMVMCAESAVELTLTVHFVQLFPEPSHVGGSGLFMCGLRRSK